MKKRRNIDAKRAAHNGTYDMTGTTVDCPSKKNGPNMKLAGIPH